MKKLLILAILLVNSVFALEKINVVYTFDDNFSLYSAISIESILKNNKSNADYRFFIIGDNLSKKSKKIIEKPIKKYKAEVEFRNWDKNKLKVSNDINQKMKNYKDIIFAKFFISDYLPNDVKRAIYIDGDTLIVDDLVKLYNLDLENNVIALAKDKLQVSLADKFKLNNYYNVGVILFDIEKYKNEKVIDKSIDFLAKNIDEIGANKKFELPEQDIINILLKDKIKTLDEKYNFINWVDEKTPDDCVIIHYANSPKPWVYIGNIGNENFKIYQKYLKKSDFFNLHYFGFWNLLIHRFIYCTKINPRIIDVFTKNSYIESM